MGKTNDDVIVETSTTEVKTFSQSPNKNISSIGSSNPGSPSRRKIGGSISDISATMDVLIDELRSYSAEINQLNVLLCNLTLVKNKHSYALQKLISDIIKEYTWNPEQVVKISLPLCRRFLDHVEQLKEKNVIKELVNEKFTTIPQLLDQIYVGILEYCNKTYPLEMQFDSIISYFKKKMLDPDLDHANNKDFNDRKKHFFSMVALIKDVAILNNSNDAKGLLEELSKNIEYAEKNFATAYSFFGKIIGSQEYLDAINVLKPSILPSQSLQMDTVLQNIKNLYNNVIIGYKLHSDNIALLINRDIYDIEKLQKEKLNTLFLEEKSKLLTLSTELTKKPSQEDQNSLEIIKNNYYLKLSQYSFNNLLSAYLGLYEGKDPIAFHFDCGTQLREVIFRKEEKLQINESKEEKQQTNEPKVGKLQTKEVEEYFGNSKDKLSKMFVKYVSYLKQYREENAKFYEDFKNKLGETTEEQLKDKPMVYNFICTKIKKDELFGSSLEFSGNIKQENIDVSKDQQELIKLRSSNQEKRKSLTNI